MKKFTLIPFERYLQYKTLLEKQGSVQDEPDIAIEKNADATSTLSITPPTELEKLSVDSILSQLPKRNKSKAQSLLSVVDNSPRLDWNNKGELVLDNTCVPTSHITDLLHDALNNTKHTPTGAEEFYAALDSVPLSLITNPRRRSLVGGKQSTTATTPNFAKLPPPGLPNKPAVALNNWQGLWRRY